VIAVTVGNFNMIELGAELVLRVRFTASFTIALKIVLDPSPFIKQLTSDKALVEKEPEK
jgi:hypothetical protein